MKIIKDAISKYSPNAKILLEIACGTGNVLSEFASKYEISVLDLSEGMLAVARKNLLKQNSLIRI